MEQNISNVSSQENEKKAKYPNFRKNLEILQKLGIYSERKFASDFDIEERTAINNLDLEDGGAKLTEILKNDGSIDMEQIISNFSSQGNEKKLKYPNFFKNLKILQQNGIYTERRFASDFNIEERKAINNLDLEDGGAKLTEILKNDVSIDTIYNAAKVGINMDNILDMLDLTEKIHRDINDGKSQIDVMFSGNALKGRWCAKFVANRHKEFKVRQLLFSTRHKGWLYIGNGITMIASDLSADDIKRIFPQRQYKYYFVFDQSSETGEGEFENNGK